MERAGSWTGQNGTWQRPSLPLTTRETVAELLVYLAECRQANVTQETYKKYIPTLQSFREDDLIAAIRALSLRERREGETAFPALATITGECRAQSKAKLENRALKESENWYADRIAHPENWVSVVECVEIAKERMARRERGESVPPLGQERR